MIDTIYVGYLVLVDTADEIDEIHPFVPVARTEEEALRLLADEADFQIRSLDDETVGDDPLSLVKRENLTTMEIETALLNAFDSSYSVTCHIEMRSL